MTHTYRTIMVTIVAAMGVGLGGCGSGDGGSSPTATEDATTGDANGNAKAESSSNGGGASAGAFKRLASKSGSPSGGVNPFEGVAPGVSRAPGSGEAQPMGYVQYKHAMGLMFQHPVGWRVEAQSNGPVKLVPGDVQVAAAGELEALIVSGDDASTVSGLNDPQVAQYFDMQMQAMAPQMRRGAGPTQVATRLGPGIALTYEGKLNNGVDGRAVFYVTMHRQMAIFLLHLGRRDLVAKREAEARRVFSTFEWGRGATDQALVGEWGRSETEFSSGVGASVGSTTMQRFRFEADGSAAYAVRSVVSADGAATAEVPWSASLQSDGGWQVSRGTWSAANGQLTVVWDNGSTETYAYGVFRHTDGLLKVKVQAAGGKAVYWDRR